LPRLFELIAEYKEGLIEIFIIFEKLEYFKWTSWDKKEYQTVLEFLNALWIQVLKEKIKQMQFEEIFTSIAKIHPSFNWMLEQWIEAESESSFYHLHEFIEQNSQGIERRSEVQSFKKNNSDKAELSYKFIQWLIYDMKPKLEVSFEKVENAHVQNQILETLEVIERVLDNKL